MPHYHDELIWSQLGSGFSLTSAILGYRLNGRGSGALFACYLPSTPHPPSQYCFISTLLCNFNILYCPLFCSHCTQQLYYGKFLRTIAYITHDSADFSHIHTQNSAFKHTIRLSILWLSSYASAGLGHIQLCIYMHYRYMYTVARSLSTYFGIDCTNSADFGHSHTPIAHSYTLQDTFANFLRIMVSIAHDNTLGSHTHSDYRYTVAN